jgi:hypothetical protein
MPEQYTLRSEDEIATLENDNYTSYRHKGEIVKDHPTDRFENGEDSKYILELVVEPRHGPFDNNYYKSNYFEKTPGVDGQYFTSRKDLSDKDLDEDFHRKDRVEEKVAKKWISNEAEELFSEEETT